MKTCNNCKAVKPLTDFAKRKDTRDGYAFKCRACDNAYQAERYKKNPDKIKAAVQRWSAANPERKKETFKAWCEVNRDEMLRKQREWWAANADEQRVKQAEWRAANKEHIAMKNAQWRRDNPGKDLAISRGKKAAKIQRTPTWSDKDKIAAIYEEAAAMRALGIDVHVDHIVPLQGKLVSGLHVHNNLQLLLAADNLTKRNKFAVSV